MLALALVAAQAVTVTVRPGPEGQCPSSRQVAEALAAQVPGALAGPGAPAPLVLAVESDALDGAATVTLTDATGVVRLRRTLPPPGPSPERDCPALAQSVALIVERYLDGLPVPEPHPVVAEAAAAPAPAPRWGLGLRAGWRPGPRFYPGAEILVAARRALGDPLTLGLVAGAGGAATHTWEGGEGRLRRLSAEVELATGRPAGPGWLELVLAGGLDLHLLRESSPLESRTRVEPAPTAALSAAYLIPLSARTFVRGVAGVGCALVRHEFRPAHVPAGPPAFATERWYGKLGVEAGLSFP